MLNNSSLTEEHPKNNESRARDYKTLYRLLEGLNTRVIDDSFETSASGIITYELHHLYLGFSAQVRANSFRIFDNELDTRIRDFLDAWDAVMGYEEFLDPGPQFIKFMPSHLSDNPDEVVKARESFDADFARMRKPYVAFIEYVHDKFEDINLDKTNKVAAQSLPLPPRHPEKAKIEATEEERQKPDIPWSRIRWPQIRWTERTLGRILIIVGIPAGIVTIIVGILTAIDSFYGDGGYCYQQNPPSIIDWAADLVCREDPAFVEEPLLSSTPTPTSTQTRTLTPSNTVIQTSTPSQTSVPTEALTEPMNGITPEISISEIMFVPQPPFEDKLIESWNEYVELHNFGNVPLDVSGWWISDGGVAGYPDQIIAWNDRLTNIPVGLGITDSTVIPPGGFALILSIKYDEGNRPYDDLIPADAIILTIADNPETTSEIIGKDGLSASGEYLDVLVLYIGTSSVIEVPVSTYGTPQWNENGDPATIRDDGLDTLPRAITSDWGGFRRLILGGADTRSNWARFEWADMSPGY